jgi:hypothetical protein
VRKGSRLVHPGLQRSGLLSSPSVALGTIGDVLRTNDLAPPPARCLFVVTGRGGAERQIPVDPIYQSTHLRSRSHAVFDGCGPGSMAGPFAALS